MGKYEELNKISGQNILLKTEYSAAKKLFLRYKIKDVNLIKSSDFIPLNQIDLLISQNNLYFIDSFELQIIPLVDVKSITFFWEKIII